jgi:HD-GYP domain-containing protein (c-di-GMP phosphodiesterase class II)
MKGYIVKDIPQGSFFSTIAYLDNQFILAAPETPFSKELIRTLLDWEFREVFSDGEPRESYFDDDVDSEEVLGGGSGGIDTSSMSDSDQVQKAERFVKEFQTYVESVFTKVSMKKDINFKEVAEKIKAVCDIIKDDRRFLFRAEKMAVPHNESNYLAWHTVKSTILAIIIGSQLKMPTHRLIELGVAAMLHEVGMIKLPPQIYLSKRALSPQEKKLIFTHPILAFNTLKALDFPVTICVAALEHHERENGAGYPQKLTGDKISLYAKIIAVACSYEALTSSRPHKEAQNGYAGMIDLLKNEGKQYDENIVKALVFSLSIYPIGLYVLLSNGKRGQVVDVNPENPRLPIVQVFGELTPDGKNKTLQTSQDGVSISRPLNFDEIPSS